MRSSSLILATKHHVKSPREYRDSLIHDWYLKQEYVDLLQAYFQRRISAQKLFEIAKDGEITLDNQVYSITWLNHPSRIRVIGNALLSFRRCRFLGVGYVLVKCLFENEDKELTFPELIINNENFQIEDKLSLIKRFVDRIHK